MKTAAPSVSAESVRRSLDLRRNVLRIERRVGRGRPRIRWIARSKRLRPKASASPVLLTASRTVTRTPRQTGTSAAISGTSRPTATSSPITWGGAKNVSTSKLTSVAVKTVSPYAPSAPSGRATPSERTA